MDDSDIDLWSLLGLPADAAEIPVPDDVWDAAVSIATDPNTSPVDADLVPDTDGVTAYGDDSSALYGDEILSSEHHDEDSIVDPGEGYDDDPGHETVW